MRQNQRYRDRVFPEAMRKKNANVLYGAQSAVEREMYMDCEVPEMGYKRLFYHDVVEKNVWVRLVLGLKLQIRSHFCPHVPSYVGN